MVDVVVQIINYNTKKYLLDCIEGVLVDLRNSELSYRVLILDNNSKDDLSDLEREYKEKQVNFYYSDKNLGFGGGHNLLSRKAKSKYILILNPDIKFLKENTIKRLIDKIKEFNKGGVIGPMLVNSKGETQKYDHGELDGFKAWLLNNTGYTFWQDRNNLTKASWVSGAFLLIKRTLFEDVGRFDENFFLYKEEEDLCLRIREVGSEIIYDPSVKVFHYGSVVATKNEFMEKSRNYFIEKHFKNRFYYPVLKIIAGIVNKFI